MDIEIRKKLLLDIACVTPHTLGYIMQMTENYNYTNFSDLKKCITFGLLLDHSIQLVDLVKDIDHPAVTVTRILNGH